MSFEELHIHLKTNSFVFENKFKYVSHMKQEEIVFQIQNILMKLQPYLMFLDLYLTLVTKYLYNLKTDGHEFVVNK